MLELDDSFTAPDFRLIRIARFPLNCPITPANLFFPSICTIISPLAGFSS